MELHLNENQIKKWVVRNADSLGLDESKLDVRYIYNPGGFVNQSYRVSDGQTTLQIKLARTEKAHRLKQWASISEHLSTHYNVPKLIEVITEEIIEGYTFGLVFNYIEGKSLSTLTNANPIIENVLHSLHHLHTDQAIQQMIRTDKQEYSYADAFAQEYISRFQEDLDIIRSQQHLLDFVTSDSITWFESEVEALEQLVRSTPSFQMKATDIVHNDINWENVLVDNDNEFWIIDWDDLTGCGDAAMDYSVFLWTKYNKQEWPYWSERVLTLAGVELFERLEYYFRAKLLDNVIDLLADYIEADNIPELKEITQKRAKEIHLSAYSEYKRIYAR
ncbi:aminoglycoside phosphotransferase family protein [Paenibacillus endoradicis]|uniref:aminoglycoside phosphotransferase family protein n=1 Tax=Paenibacillus endoradicis TaxID=2972487 RepID=UPI0021598F22|nr:aminoglycoside phosphotransferase family protein [Paenibacillus endoradicis]MCR8656368.1 aminoglycoside phosphotransferase family protein [Paenibacillus endoradicis]